MFPRASAAPERELRPNMSAQWLQQQLSVEACYV